MSLKAESPRPLFPPTHDPASALAEFEQILLSNSGEDAFESAIKLLSAKLFDELNLEDKGETLFKIHSTPENTFKAIQSLYERALHLWPALNGSGVSLGITPPHLVRSIKPLLGWKLLNSNLSCLDATLERLVSRDSKGALGQYFTSRNIIHLCVQILNPSPKDLVIDPACGSAGFLFEASRYSWKNYNGFPKSLGIDFSSKSVKVATLLSIATRHNSIAITKSNSLDGRELKGIAPSEWNDFLCQTAGSSTMRAASWGPWNQLGCDVLLTNPPFAGDLDEFDMLDAYESQLDNTGKKTVSREHLFLERSIQLLKPGGRLAIVLPQGVLSNSNASYLRNWLLAKVRILGVIGMHQYAFLPYTSVKTALLFIEKPDLNEVLPSDYPIYFAVSQKSGKDSSGREVGNTDYEDIARSFCQFLLEQKRPWAAQTEQPEVLDIPIEKVMFSEIQRTGRLDAEHYDPIARVIERKVSRLSNQRIGEAIDRKISKFKKQNFQEISYMDISAVDGRTGLLFPETILAEDAPSRASYLVEEGDVLVSTVRPDRNVVALVTSGFESTTVASNGFCVLRGKGIPSELLFAYCKTDAFKKMLTMHSAASMYPTVSDKDIHNIPFLRPPVETEDEVVRMIRDGLQKISDAQAEIKNAISLVDKFLQDEQLKVL